MYDTQGKIATRGNSICIPLDATFKKLSGLEAGMDISISWTGTEFKVTPLTKKKLPFSENDIIDSLSEAAHYHDHLADLNASEVPDYE